MRQATHRGDSIIWKNDGSGFWQDPRGSVVDVTNPHVQPLTPGVGIPDKTCSLELTPDRWRYMTVGEIVAQVRAAAREGAA